MNETKSSFLQLPLFPSKTEVDSHSVLMFHKCVNQVMYLQKVLVYEFIASNLNIIDVFVVINVL